MQKKKGFTLIELLVVIAIIALLMAILMPALQRVKKQARAVVCQSNLKQWGSVLALYTEDSQGLLPESMGGALWFLRGPFIAEGDPNKPRVFQEIRAKGIACCPMAVRTADDDNAPGHFSASGGTYWIEARAAQRLKHGKLLPRLHGFAAATDSTSGCS